MRDAGARQATQRLPLLEEFRAKIRARAKCKPQVTLSPEDGRSVNQYAVQLCAAIETEFLTRHATAPVRKVIGLRRLAKEELAARLRPHVAIAFSA
jgi:hypothetical protein